LEAGSSGAGPYYGILPLDRWNDAADTASGTIPDDYLSRECPLIPNMPKGDDWRETLGCSYDERYQGAITVAHLGCTYYALLVVTGRARGRVVYVDLEGGPPYFLRDLDFLAWYERWLDELLWGYDGSWFGFGLPGREDDLACVLREAEVSSDLRSEALTTLSRIPDLSGTTLDVVKNLLHDPSADVRCKAVHLLGKHIARPAADEIRSLLQDVDASVRRAALEALMSLPGVAWESAARTALRDASPEVVFYALCRLKDAGILRTSDLIPLYHSPDPKIRSDAAWASEAIKDESGVPPEILLHDPDIEVRRYAILGQMGKEGRSRVPTLIAMVRKETDLDLVECLVSKLGNLGDRRAVPVLMEMAKHPDGFVRQGAAHALGMIRDTRAIACLQSLLLDNTKPSRRDERDGTGKSSTLSVADTARDALGRFSWWRRLFWRSR